MNFNECYAPSLVRCWYRLIRHTHTCPQNQPERLNGAPMTVVETLSIDPDTRFFVSLEVCFSWLSCINRDWSFWQRGSRSWAASAAAKVRNTLIRKGDVIVERQVHWHFFRSPCETTLPKENASIRCYPQSPRR